MFKGHNVTKSRFKPDIISLKAMLRAIIQHKEMHLLLHLMICTTCRFQWFSTSLTSPHSSCSNCSTIQRYSTPLPFATHPWNFVLTNSNRCWDLRTSDNGLTLKSGMLRKKQYCRCEAERTCTGSLFQHHRGTCARQSF